MPLIRRMPKRGFNNARFEIRYMPVNVDSLNIFEEGAVVDVAAMQAAGLASGPVKLVKILGEGEITKKLSVIANGFSATAKSKIEKVGGTWKLASKSQSA